MHIAELFSPSVPSLQRHTEKIIGAFEEVALRTSDGTTSLDEILRLIGRRLCELLDVSRCSVYLRGDDGLFFGRAGYCSHTDIDTLIQRLVAGVEGDEFTREIVATGRPVLVRDARHDPRTVQRTMKRWDVRDMLGVPLVVEEETIGIIYVDNEDDPHVYSEEEIHVAVGFASLAAVALRQARLYSELERHSKVVERQRRMLEHSAEIQSRLTHAVLHGASVSEMLATVSDIVGKPVTLYGHDFRVAAWAGPDHLGIDRPPAIPRSALTMPWVRESIGKLDSGQSTVVLPPAPDIGLGSRRLLGRLVFDGRTRGYLEVCEIGRRLTMLDPMVIEQAATAVSLQLLTEQRQADAEGEAREDYLADLLHGRRDVSSLERRAALFGVDAARPHVVVRLQYVSDTSGPESSSASARRAQVSALLERVLEQKSEILATSVPGAVVALVTLPAGPEVDAIRWLGERLRAHFEELRSTVDCRYIVVSGACATLGHVAAAGAEARDLQGLVEETDAPAQVVLASDLGVLRLVARRDGIEGAQRFATELLSPLIQSDGSGGGQLVDTLESYLEQGGNIRATASLLGVHENTVRYRLGRIRELSVIDSENFESLLDAKFALNALRLLQPSEAG